MTVRERSIRQRIVRCIFRTLRQGTLPEIRLTLLPPLGLEWPLWHYGDYDRRADVMRVWIGRDFEDTCWHEAVHAAEARLGLRHSEERATTLALHLGESYELPDLRETHRCPTCGQGVYVGLERCRRCDEAFSWPHRIPARRGR